MVGKALATSRRVTRMPRKPARKARRIIRPCCRDKVRPCHLSSLSFLLLKWVLDLVLLFSPRLETTVSFAMLVVFGKDESVFA